MKIMSEDVRPMNAEVRPTESPKIEIDRFSLDRKPLAHMFNLLAWSLAESVHGFARPSVARNLLKLSLGVFNNTALWINDPVDYSA